MGSPHFIYIVHFVHEFMSVPLIQPNYIFYFSRRIDCHTFSRIGNGTCRLFIFFWPSLCGIVGLLWSHEQLIEIEIIVGTQHSSNKRNGVKAFIDTFVHRTLTHLILKSCASAVKWFFLVRTLILP